MSLREKLEKLRERPNNIERIWGHGMAEFHSAQVMALIDVALAADVLTGNIDERGELERALNEALKRLDEVMR